MALAAIFKKHRAPKLAECLAVKLTISLVQHCRRPLQVFDMLVKDETPGQYSRVPG
jgi:hypothetical protein